MDKCGKCGEDIEGEAVRTTGSAYHGACFKCEVHRGKLASNSTSPSKMEEMRMHLCGLTG